MGTTYTLAQPAYVAIGTVSNFDYGNSFVPSIYDFHIVDPSSPAVTVPPGMYWILALDSSNGITHDWKYSLVGTPTVKGSFGGGYWADCGSGRGSTTFYNINVN
ncbi:hypothetical protein [Ralstonia solanacearum]|uniref:hypothetical protein n=1 Tax=Ralstonia solanacearum TaxID=305 RepID=UPI00202A9905|nr:hypothetical protein [Ralstonia solanacearum]MCL9844626.1 hypothetical protein [Ralstonia solanacearum]MDC6253155.1 hypothetical protein [Ralstonia solanacearum]MDC6257737.1 hypothetical protein [Ralstonia solanacearum]MDC6301607.1 hypothetical protein [Ralstonia solanacearum]